MDQTEIYTLSTQLERPSPYYLGDQIAHLLPRHIAPHEPDRIVLVSARLPYDLFGGGVLAPLADHRYEVSTLLIEEGEGNKGWHTLSGLCERLVEAGVTRDSLILSLGGGVVGNIVGMAAGLLYRGVRYVEIPTTLMALTDGTLSNKQAINGRLGKNQFGLYYAPLFIWADVSYARTEPPRQTISALVEGIKNGLIHDPAYLERFAEMLRGGLTGLVPRLRECALGLIRSKLDILRADPTERRYAVVLEYGHTFGHAIEWLSAGALHHGEAVSIGMCAAAHLAAHLGLLSRESVELHYHMLADVLGAPVRLPDEIAPSAVYQAMLCDNKRRRGRLGCLLLEEPGRVHNASGDYLTEVRPADVAWALERVQARAA